MFKNLTGFAQLLKNAGSLSQKMKDSKEKLRKQEVVGRCSTGEVVVQMNGLGEVKQITLADSIKLDSAPGRLESHLIVAINQGIGKARQLHVEAIKEVTGGIELPGMKEMLNDLVDQIN